MCNLRWGLMYALTLYCRRFLNEAPAPLFQLLTRCCATIKIQVSATIQLVIPVDDAEFTTWVLAFVLVRLAAQGDSLSEADTRFVCGTAGQAGLVCTRQH